MTTQMSFFQTVKRLFGGDGPAFELPTEGHTQLSALGTHILLGNASYQLEMGEMTLQVVRDCPLRDGCDVDRMDLLVSDPRQAKTGLSHFLRIRPGQRIEFNQQDDEQQRMLSAPRDVFRRRLQIKYNGETAVFRVPISEPGTYLSVLDVDGTQGWWMARRRTALAWLEALMPWAPEGLEPEPAGRLLSEVSEILREESFRRKDRSGRPGALLELPAHLTPVLLGDLHGQVDNLLKILCEGGFLEALQRDEAALILLGDLVHREEPEQLEEMHSSLLMMDMVLTLKRRFPANFFILQGNHDSFSPEVMKSGVPQSLLWEKHVQRARGDAYRTTLQRFYQRLPLLALSDDFAACHAGAPRRPVTRDALVAARQSPELVAELTRGRVMSPQHPSGYGAGDVSRLRKGLALPPQTPFIVAHYPLTTDATLWGNVGRIEHHHIVYSARPDIIGVFTRIGSVMQPQEYRAERLLDQRS